MFESFRRGRPRFPAWLKRSPSPWNGCEPIRAELVSVDRLEQLAIALAQDHRNATARARGYSLGRRMRQNSVALRRNYLLIAHATRGRQNVPPAAQWFIDNYYLVERQLRILRDDLPASYYRQLPKLVRAPMRGLPRIAGMAWDFIAHTDSAFDASMLIRYVQAYQRIEVLTIGELWALSSMLRVVLLENLRRNADLIVRERHDRELADQLADRLLGSPTRPPEPLDRLIESGLPRGLPHAFAVQLVRRFRDVDPNETPAVSWFEETLKAAALTAEKLVQDELQGQSATNVTVQNIVTGLTRLAAIDWAEIVESLSAVDAVLRGDDLFGRMDFASRNLYRTAIEELARSSRFSELEVAQRAVRAVRQLEPRDSIASDPGRVLIGPERATFEATLGCRPPLRQSLRRALLRTGIAGYVGALGVLTLLALGALSTALPGLSLGLAIPLLAFSAVPLSEALAALLNAIYTRLLPPQILPALDLAGAVPASARTLVAMPVLLTGAADVPELVERLETHFLSNARGELYFALLADGADADAEELPEDAALIEAGRSAIDTLNHRYGPGESGDRFLWLYRRRRWNPAQRRWMGWERKRGKLHELNRLLRGARDTSFALDADAHAALPAAVRYVLVLDADTRTSPAAAEKLIGKLSHPLNSPQYDPAARRVTSGYAILQPLVVPALPSDPSRSLLQELLSGAAGLDPYAFAVSDLYQDLCGEGSYTGKGLYDVDCFESCMDGRIADNTILSHDLLEGLLARSALASDVTVLESAPDRYDVAAAREHRWARGDWQLLPWLLGINGAPSLLGRWKIVDNLRRTMLAPATVLALLASWWLPPRLACFWSAVLLVATALPALLAACLSLWSRPSHLRWASGRNSLGREFWQSALTAGLHLALLADRAARMVDAIACTLIRLMVTRRHLLDWTTAAQTRRDSRTDVGHYLEYMSGGVAVVGLLAALVLFARPPGERLALPWLALWLAAPWIASRVSAPRDLPAATRLSDADSATLRLVARETWGFFERFVTAAEHHLPPDNFQETPQPVIAHRTSPTNVGLYLLSSASAYQFGWLGLLDWVDRLEATFAVLERLPRHRGHFLNWYDTATLTPLQPMYVSTVDSGNLAGHLLTLANAIEAASTGPLWGPQRVAGIHDAVALADAAAGDPDNAAPPALDRFLDAVRTAAAGSAAAAAASSPLRLRQLASLIDESRASSGADHEWRPWSRAAVDCTASHLRDADLLSPAQAEFSGDAAALADLAGPGFLGDARSEPARGLLARLQSIAVRARRLADEMDFSFLLDPTRMLLSIGFRVNEGVLDASYYDLLASEARLASYLAVAKRDVPTRHWFRLGRALVPVGDSVALVSWSGSMFEYLMPSLIMAEPPGSLLEQTTRAAVRCQREYASARGMPWGISESAYNQRDLQQTYQYSSFGVPVLGLKRGLADNAVISPYSTGLAAMVEPRPATLNFQALRALGAVGRFGYFEALDFTPARLADGERLATVRTYMAHHQGMTIVALANALHEGVMRRHFHAEPIVRAAELLLQERPPRFVEEPLPDSAGEPSESGSFARIGTRRRRVRTWSAHTPQSQLLSNGHYAVLVNAAGSGLSYWRDLAITRWHEDRTPDEGGHAVYVRDRDNGTFWSAGFQPTSRRPDAYQATLAEDRVEIVRRDGSVGTTLEVLVSAEHDAEARRVTITNRGTRAREIELTSYAELVLTGTVADRAHRAFSNLFIETQYVAELEGLLAVRHPRAPTEPTVWSAHIAVVEGQTAGAPEYETDRAQFLGRTQRLSLPRALQSNTPLSGSVGYVLDPIFSLRRRLLVPRGANARVTFWTVVAETREAALQIADKCRDPAAFGRASTLAWTRAQVQLHHLGVDAEDAGTFQRVASHVFYFNPTLRASGELLRQNRSGPPDLWALGISGDLPIVVAQIDAPDQLELIRQLVRAHEYWSLQNLAVDLILINESAESYSQELQAAIETLARSRLTPGSASVIGKGRIFTLRAAHIAAPSRQALTSAARALFVGRRGSLLEQLDRMENIRSVGEPPAALAAPRAAASSPTAPALETMEFFNGLGGFIRNGLEYQIALPPGRCTPMPWINVIAQPEFGFQVSAEGGGFTWSGNSRQNPLTSWSNDPIGDPPPEVFYVRDDDSGALWCPTATPIREPEGHYVARHGQGYSIFQYQTRGIALELRQFVPRDASFKVSRLELRNDSRRVRKISVCAYLEWALGPARAANAPYIITERCAETGALLARNPWNAEFAARVAFLDMCGAQTSGTADRRDFLGADGSLEAPAALTGRDALAMRAGAGLDPCAALMTGLELLPGETKVLNVLLGQAEDRAAAVATIGAAREMDLEAAYVDIRSYWQQLLGAVQVTTPDRSLDLLVNGWLLYQTLSCRMWARSAFYQAGGAYGYRDQLQDAMALGIAAPQVARTHLIRAAGRQFPSGDVQHWWMPETGRGVRTRISDDRVWLAYCVAQYVRTTGDRLLLEERVPFLSGADLDPNAKDSYFQPAVTDVSATIFEHCALALDTSLEIGVHGLPLMGGGDWNDGLNAVGAAGRGESVWLGWFLCATLSAFIPLAESRGEHDRAARWHSHARNLGVSLEQAGWDGDWYRRGFFDDGTALGSAGNSECRIDAIAQSWGVLSGAANPARAAHAMAAVSEQLWQPESGLALLFTPPFTSDTRPDPGYIKAYPPGVRENGGQYTHGAIWSLMAFAQLGDGNRAKQWFDVLNPINRARNGADVDRYRLEPYVVAADVYAASGLIGRGGWSWYTGSAGWLYRAGLESMLGFRLQGEELVIEPCVPRTWRRFDIAFRYRSSRYQLTVTNPFGVSAGVNHAEVDHRTILRAPIRVPLLDDGAEHVVRVVMG